MNILVVGEASVGKTSLIQNLTNETHIENNTSITHNIIHQDGNRRFIDTYGQYDEIMEFCTNYDCTPDVILYLIKDLHQTENMMMWKSVFPDIDIGIIITHVDNPTKASLISLFSKSRTYIEDNYPRFKGVKILVSGCSNNAMFLSQAHRLINRWIDGDGA